MLCGKRHRHRYCVQALLRLRRPDRLHPQPQQGADGRGYEVLPGTSVRSYPGPSGFLPCIKWVRVLCRRARGIQAPPGYRGPSWPRSPASSASAPGRLPLIGPGQTSGLAGGFDFLDKSIQVEDQGRGAVRTGTKGGAVQLGSWCSVRCTPGGKYDPTGKTMSIPWA